MIPYNEAYDSTVAYFDGDELAAKVFLDKYALRNKQDELLEKTPEDMHWRLAKEIARIEKEKFKKPLSEQEIFDCFDKFKRIVPQGSIMYGLGNPYQYASLSNCFVAECPKDSYGGILYTDEQLVQISKRRGGVGIDISNLRPNGTPTTNAAKTSTGILSFMDRYSHSIREVGQSGRRGALILTLSVHHPEIQSFITSKNNKEKVTGANISIRLTDEFFKAVENDEDYEQRWPVDSTTPTILHKVNARKIWLEIIHNAWLSAEPGLLFWDNILNESIPDCYANLGFKTVSTNPCAELILCELDSCRLLLLNTYSYVKNPFTTSAKFDFESFYNDVQLAQRFMDDIIDLELEHINRIIQKIIADPEDPKIKERELNLWKGISKKCEDGRRTGTGVTAIGDTLAALGFTYGSHHSVKKVSKIYQTLKFGCYRASVDMAKELTPFPIFNSALEKDNPFIERLKSEEISFNNTTIKGKSIWKDMQQYGRRNIALMTTSPAGSVSLLTQTTSGIEPLFQPIYIRRKKISDPNIKEDFTDKTGDRWQNYTVNHPKTKDWMSATGKNMMDELPWKCADDIDWKQRIKLQAAAQQHTDHSISSTVNVPADTEEWEIEEIYNEARTSGLKGITVYRQGCRDGVLVDIDQSDKQTRPKELECDVYHISVKGTEYFVLVGLWKDSSPYEVFAGKNGCMNKKIKKGKIIRKRKNTYKFVSDDGDTELSPITAVMCDMEETISRLTSGLLRTGADMNFIVDQLEKVGGDKEELHNFGKCLARSLKKYIRDKLVRISGCPSCVLCGYSKCN
jgi:ribonucleoside-diphosphate reductase alpha chain